MPGGAVKDDDIGCVVAVVVVLAIAWWAWENYEIRERSVEPEPISLAPLPRPSGSIELTSLKSGTVWHLDADSVAGARTSRQAWVTADHSKDNGTSARTSKTLYLVDCETGAVKKLSYVAYTANGDVTDTHDTKSEDAEVTYYPPGTVGASVPNEICRPAYGE